MKKALAILMIFALVASVAFAEVSIGAWGRGIFLPVSNGPDDTLTDTAPSWGGWPGDEARIGFTLAGNSDNVGFQIDGNVDGGAFSVGDQQKIWVKPMDMVTLQLGRIYDDTLRGNAAFGSFNWYRGLGYGDGEDVTFSRIGIEGSREAFEVAITPMDPLYVALYFYDLDKDHTSDMFAKMQAALGYSIDGVGQFKAQILTSEATSDAEGKVDDMQTAVEVAFNYTGMENLFVELGFAMNTNADVDPEETKKIALYGNYAVDAAKIHLMAVYKLMESDNRMHVGAGLDYDVGDGVGVSADVHYMDDVWTGSGDSAITFFAGVTKGFSNGVVGAGVQVRSEGDTYIGIPVRMEYWF